MEFIKDMYIKLSPSTIKLRDHLYQQAHDFIEQQKKRLKPYLINEKITGKINYGVDVANRVAHSASVTVINSHTDNFDS